jgi:hypothetical protein
VANIQRWGYFMTDAREEWTDLVSVELCQSEFRRMLKNRNKSL